MAELKGLKKYRKKWDKYTEGWFGTIIYLILGFVIAYAVNVGLSQLLETSTPVVAVFSCSMEHDTFFNGWFCGISPDSLCGKKIEGDPGTLEEYWDVCGDWYEAQGISQDAFKNFDFSNGLNVGDMIIVRKDDNISVGDIVVLNTRNKKYPIIHRVYGITADGDILTKGDANGGPDNWNPTIKKENIYGKAVLRFPLLGWVKIIFVELTGIA